MHNLIRCYFFAIFILFSANSFAQDGPRANGPGAMLEQTRKVLDDLNLSADQKTETDAILDRAKSDGEKLRAELPDMDPQQRGEKVRELMTSTRSKIEGVLNEDQKQQLAAKIAEMREKTGQRFGDRIGQFRQALSEMDLKSDQRAKTDAAMNDLRSKMQDAAQEVDQTQRQQKVRQAMADLRQQISQILTAEQMQTLREKMQQQPASEAKPPMPEEKPATQPAPQAMMNQDPMKPAADTKVAAEKPIEKPKAGLEIGQPAPDFKLTKLDGTVVQLSSLKGRVIALVFGSFTCPPFRDRAASIDQLNTNLGTRATIFWVYTKEANPADIKEIERNKDDKISVKQATSIDDRKNQARQARSALRLNMPVLVDSMEDSTSNAYSLFPNGAVVINRDGTIAAKQSWVEAGVLKRQIEQAIK